MIIENQEHFEAYQEDINSKRRASYETLDAETKSLMLEIDNLGGRLAKKNIRHAMFIEDKTKPKLAFLRFNYIFAKKHEDLFSKDAKNEAYQFFCVIILEFLSWVSSCGWFEVCAITPPQKKGDKPPHVCSNHFKESYKLATEGE